MVHRDFFVYFGIFVGELVFEIDEIQPSYWFEFVPVGDHISFVAGDDSVGEKPVFQIHCVDKYLGVGTVFVFVAVDDSAHLRTGCGVILIILTSTDFDPLLNLILPVYRGAVNPVDEFVQAVLDTVQSAVLVEFLLEIVLDLMLDLILHLEFLDEDVGNRVRVQFIFILGLEFEVGEAFPLTELPLLLADYAVFP